MTAECGKTCNLIYLMERDASPVRKSTRVDKKNKKNPASHKKILIK